MDKTKYSRSGFTLIELLTVIAIIGILAAILIPAVGAVRKKASQATSSSNMRQIALAYNNFSTSGGRTQTIRSGEAYSATATTSAADMLDWALVLAQGAELIDASIYIIDNDPFLSGGSAPAVLPQIVGTRQADGSFEPNPDWTSAPEEIVGYAGVAGMSNNANGSTTPLLWTKGLQTSGFWDPQENPWGNDGGHIVFMDGHVTFYDNVAEPAPGRLVANSNSANAGDATANILDAIDSSPNAEPLDPSGTL
jgi:prepilin-type N-terminal cleavage/methylation domain-containing protein/prepilin-type processing-associated H-X9-DG protein